MSAARWVVHLPTRLTDRAAAVALARALRDSLAHVVALDFGETTLSEEDDQSRRIRIWCDAPVAGGRCVLGVGHAEGCSRT